MKAVLALAVLVAGCASFDGRGLVPGRSTAEEVDRLKDGRLVAVEQRLTDESVAKIVPNASTGSDVRSLLGPPYVISAFPRLNREVWQYHMRHFGDPGIPVALYVQFSLDGLAREVYLINETGGSRGSGRS